MFQNDLVYNTNKSKLAMYVDNHQVYACGERIKKDVERILNNEGMCISEWYQDNLLGCNHK